MNRLLPILVVAAMILAACAGNRPQLEPRRGGNPEQVDLSGQWALREGSALPVTVEQTIRIPRENDLSAARSQRSRGSPRRSKGSAVHVFLESGVALKVTQTDYGLFFSFDRAIVEEYNFGENISVSVGPIEAQRVSGWDGRSFVVETMDSEGNVLSEVWRLEKEGAELVREIAIVADDEQSFFSRQRFDRK